MIFSVQRYLEDYFERRRLDDPDQYAVKLANVVSTAKPGTDLLPVITKIRTVFFRSNTQLQRKAFEAELARTIAARFKKKSSNEIFEFPGGVASEARRIKRLPRREIATVLDEFKHAIEARAVDSFWVSRRRGELARRPETIGQALLATFLQGVVLSGGFSTREVGSGVGYVDVLLFLSTVPHVIELKILTKRFQGPSQLTQYMRHEKRKVGWLVVFDTRSAGTELPTSVTTPAGLVRIVCIEINPVPPSRS